MLAYKCIKGLPAFDRDPLDQHIITLDDAMLTTLQTCRLMQTKGMGNVRSGLGQMIGL
jgi:hypothetical protein